MLQQDFGRKTEDLEGNERTSESKITIPFIFPNHKIHAWTGSVIKIPKILVFASLEVGIDYFSCNQADKDDCAGHEFSFKMYSMDCIVYPTSTHTLQ